MMTREYLHFLAAALLLYGCAMTSGPEVILTATPMASGFYVYDLGGAAPRVLA